MSRTRLSRRDVVIGSTAIVAGLGLKSAVADDALTEVLFVATPAAPDCVIAVAIEEGLFRKAGIDAKLSMVAIMPNVPAAVMSGSAQVGFMTTPTLLQAVDGGLDLVAICGGQITSSKIDDAAIIARPDVAIAKPADFVGKQIGVPGLNAFFHVMFRYWLSQQGVDPTAVTYLEVTFPTMGDALRSKSVDAVLAIEPFYSAIADSGAGKVVARIMKDIPDGLPEVMFVATRAYADAHRAQIIALRDALAQAEAMVNTDRELGLKHLVKYVKLPPAVLPHVSLGIYDPKLDTKGLGWWTDTMKKQDLLGGKLDVARVIWS